jgi:hypothetical protein
VGLTAPRCKTEQRVTKCYSSYGLESRKTRGISHYMRYSFRPYSIPIPSMFFDLVIGRVHVRRVG